MSGDYRDYQKIEDLQTFYNTEIQEIAIENKNLLINVAALLHE